MKAQAATIEAMISMLLLGAAAAYTANAYYLASEAGSASNFNYPNLFYDFFSSAYANQSFSSCINNLNQSCGAYFLSGFSSAYRMRGLSVQAEGREVQVGSMACQQSQYYCMLVPNQGNYGEACLYACGA